MTEQKKIVVNLLSTVCNFIITILIGLAVTPYIVNRLGGEAYGFVGLANNFVGYAGLITIALNSMASRFVSVALFSKNYEDANKYFTSVFYANLLLAVIMAPVLVVIVWKLQVFIEIPDALLVDVKTAFAITFIQFISNVLLARFEIATFVANKLYLTQRNNIISSCIRLFTIILCFTIFSTRITFLTLGSLLGTLFIYAMDVYYTKKFLPELHIRREYFDFSYIKELVSSGIWNLIGKLNAILLDGLDLLIANIFIGSSEMGALALSKTVPAMFMTLRGTLDYPFGPPMTRCYAEKNTEGVIKFARLGNKILGVFMIAPMAVFVVFGIDFFRLWIPGENHVMIQFLSLLSIMNLVSGACINSAFTICGVVNKIKVPALVSLGMGIVTLITNFVLLENTDWGVYIIAGVSSVYGMLRNYLFSPLYGAYCLKVKWTTFYHEIITGNICLVINLGIGYLFHRILPADSWITLILSGGITALILIGINMFFVFSREERKEGMDMIKRKIFRKA